jgi:CubicO group peptidase (beta-lactamase class C family)
VIDHLPWFRLSDPYVTREFTIRDLLTHRSGLGLGAGDLLWMGTNYGSEEIVRRLASLKPVTSFRTAYAYDNVLYIAAGLVVAQASGMSWNDFVAQRIFTPLGMTGASTRAAGLRLADDGASPHARVDGRTVVVRVDTVDNIGGAGTIIASVNDVAKWMITQLDSGRAPDGKRLWNAARTREMWTGVTVQPIGTPAPSLRETRANFSEYALGWQVRDWRGHRIVTHTGGLAGMLSRTLLVPDQRLGIVVLTNGDTPLYHALSFWIADRYLQPAGTPVTDWAAAYRAASASGDAQVDSTLRAQDAARAKDSKPSLPLARYAGTYTDAMYGDASIALENGTPVLRFSRSPAYVGDLAHWHYDTFVVRWRQRSLADAFVSFRLAPDGAIENFSMKAFRPDADFSYDYQDLLFVPKATARRGAN